MADHSIEPCIDLPLAHWLNNARRQHNFTARWAGSAGAVRELFPKVRPTIAGLVQKVDLDWGRFADVHGV